MARGPAGGVGRVEKNTDAVKRASLLLVVSISSVPVGSVNGPSEGTTVSRMCLRSGRCSRSECAGGMT